MGLFETRDVIVIFFSIVLLIPLLCVTLAASLGTTTHGCALNWSNVCRSSSRRWATVTWPSDVSPVRGSASCVDVPQATTIGPQ